MKSVVIFGGAGFIGTHLVNSLLQRFETIYIADIRKPCWHPGTFLPDDERIKYAYCDVRKSIDESLFEPIVECIFNLAAVHTTPGHAAKEYFEANILGAENICKFAEKCGCKKIIFTSSISVYGPGEDEKNEELIPMPVVPYGTSKIIAEYIHKEWFRNDPANRMLTIVRPGVVFGKGEGGNFTRIANALQKGIFAYPGRDDTIKACLYVKDLCKFLTLSANRTPGWYLYNLCYPEKITIKEVVQSFKKTLGYSTPEIVLPYPLITVSAVIANLMPLPFIKKMGIVPERIIKLVKSTNISAQKLINSGFKFDYPLQEAIKDWANDCGSISLY
jgi:nucleoside-diphosphate-sugar epimerase